MRKTFCDRHPEVECTSRIGLFNFTIIHKTNKGEVVSEDQFSPLELCGECIDELFAGFLVGRAPLSLMREPRYPGEEAIIADTPLPFPRGIAADSPERIAAIAQERAAVNDYPAGTRDE